jgi:hypothetical protein
MCQNLSLHVVFLSLVILVFLCFRWGFISILPQLGLEKKSFVVVVEPEEDNFSLDESRRDDIP